MDKTALERRLKEIIKADGRSQASMARKLGVGADTFNKWLRGVNRMPDDAIASFCEQLGLGTSIQIELLTLAGYTVPENLLAAPSTASLLQFASRVAPDGMALDPGLTFSAEVIDLYAVFSPKAPLAGTQINVDTPDPNGRYAFLKLPADGTVSRIGWRWYYNGAVINEYEMDVKPGSIVWLQKFRYEGSGIFNDNPPFGRGQLRIVLLLGGNPSMSATVTIV